jgi:hypothetical protein
VSIAIKAQRNKYIALRVANPALRLRSDHILGPRIQVTVSESRRAGLQMPEMWFVELKQYQKDNPGKDVKQCDITYEDVAGDGVMVAGVS